MVWVIVDRLTKCAHFLATRQDVPLTKMAKMYIDEIVSKHDVPLSIVSDRDTSYHTSIGMPPFEMLYGRRCRTPSCWIEAGKKQITAKKVNIAKEALRVARERQKTYADKKRRSVEFEVGDMVMLKVSPWKGVIRFAKKGKLSPRFIRTFKVLKRIKDVAYQLELPPELDGIHNTFHVSYLRKCLAEQSSVIPIEDVSIDLRKRMIEELIAILGRKQKKLPRKMIDLILIKWKHNHGESVTWETKSVMKEKYPELFIFDQIPGTESF
uniref:uncharacterized protein LOC122587710 n=1 Tax=Erigeron canadensis TaxID=72917 RepID=UPI001CB902EC|nr:uncharacterized protein LOC122587710 [Erigeron canadensis]